MGWISWLCPGIQLKRWLLLFTVGIIVCAFSLALLFNSQVMGMAEELLFRLSYLATGKYGNGVTIAIGLAGRSCHNCNWRRNRSFHAVAGYEVYYGELYCGSFRRRRRRLLRPVAP